MSLEEKIVSLGKSMGLEVEERDVNELVEEHTQELTTEEIQELQSQQHTEVMQEIGFEEKEEIISTSEIKEILGMWETVSLFVEKKHPKKVATSRASDLFNDTCLTHFRYILRGRKKQISLGVFFSKWPAGESEKIIAKKAKTSEDI
ncbi:tigger transposable element-derived protein 1 [Nephila pilipes]|uniref:Tigger transposable element-derived protein 1 n=1 Tax=Nephila pilipes TaxID=299642 RepID=A0A8X6IJU1_NEPPI|nr:tigger transposable element-derived protein 1 [Nephila pilipes]GFT96663.1 tigger transposable element-derived protein 1 [Nephila pilipes]